ncbi:hypothetical protein QC764_0014910 [Podospora pseudoanserina]|uniref:Secreted protein n=1 Tax=Podospora pseudoanserina TaxID=2609844 RepID=A0ABR0INQ1_9PEZI|nr:hypothetical protein QC764_0014910 [Podospora pseudoanserina]
MCQVPNMKALPILHVASLTFPLLFFCASLHCVTSEFSIFLFSHLRDFYASYNHRSTLLYTIFATCSGGPCLVTVSPAAAASVHILFILAYTRSQVASLPVRIYLARINSYPNRGPSSPPPFGPVPAGCALCSLQAVRPGPSSVVALSRI